MSDLVEALAGIERGLDRLGRHALLRALRPGVSVGQTRDLLSSSGLPSSAQVETVYEWRDGTDTSVGSLDDIHMFPGFYLLSAEDAVANYRAFVADPRWSPGWLPLFANGGGDFYVVDLSGDVPGSVRHFRIDESEHPLEFESLTAMLSTVAAGFDRSVFFVDSNGYLEMHDLAFASLAAELNPRVPWWTE